MLPFLIELNDVLDQDELKELTVLQRDVQMQQQQAFLDRFAFAICVHLVILFEQARRHCPS